MASRKSAARKRPRTLARIMPKPLSSARSARPSGELLARLTTLAQELAGAFRPATVVELVARTLTELLTPDRLTIVLLDTETNRLAVTYDTHPVPVGTDNPPCGAAPSRFRATWVRKRADAGPRSWPRRRARGSVRRSSPRAARWARSRSRASGPARSDRPS